MSNDESSKYLVQYKDTKFYINELLIKLRNISDTALAQIIHWHKAKLALFDKMWAADDVVELRRLNELVTKCEFNLQELWGFALDENFHRWYHVPKCTCPKMDNNDRLGTKYKIYSGDCPIHGDI